MKHVSNHAMSERKFNPGIYRALDTVGMQLGGRAEELVERIFGEAEKNGKLPEWLYSWKRSVANSTVDRDGIDFTFMTDLGPIFIQIKGSAAGRRKFNFQPRKCPIRVAVINVTHPEAVTFARVIHEVTQGRNDLLADKRC